MAVELKNYDRIHWQVKPKLGATETLAKSLAACNSGDMPERIAGHVKVMILDSLACMLLGSKSEACGKLFSFVKTQGGKSECSVAASGYRTNRYMASLLNGAFCGASGADACTYDNLRCGGVVTASALAMSDLLLSEGNRLIGAIALGWETMCRLYRAAVCVPKTRPLDPTSTFGPFGAAVVTGKLLGFSAFDLENAISLCPSQSAAPAQAMYMKSEIALLHEGFAASWGVRSAYLAKEGLSGPRNILEGNMGFFKCVSGFHDDDETTRYNTDLVNEEFGTSWFLEDSRFTLENGSISDGIPDMSAVERKFAAACEIAGISAKRRDAVAQLVNEIENTDNCSEFLKLLRFGEVKA